MNEIEDIDGKITRKRETNRQRKELKIVKRGYRRRKCRECLKNVKEIDRMNQEKSKYWDKEDKT